MVKADWNPETYGRYGDARVQPAIDLLAAVGPLPKGDIVDLGCGGGPTAAELALRWPGRRLIGVDLSPRMLDKARALDVYDRLDQADIGVWAPHEAPALIYSNAALQWLGDHTALLRRLASGLVAGGVLAVQMPHQNPAPSHQGWRTVFADLFPGRDVARGPEILMPEAYFDIQSPLGEVRIWETEYLQHLPAVHRGHPVRLFTESTFARPFLEAVEEDERPRLIAAYEEAMAKAYPRRADGSVLFAFRRLFFTLRVHAS